MKLLVWGVILSLNLSMVNASPSDPSQYAHGELKATEEINKYDDSKLRNLAQSICLYYNIAGAKFGEKFNLVVKNHMSKYEGINNPTPKQITNFLNKNKNKMTCGSGKNKKNYMMVAFDESSHISLFRKVFQREYMKKDRSAKVDVNAVSYTGPGGSPETVIDYMDGLIADNKRSKGILKEVKKLRKFFVKKLGGKKFTEFSASLQEEYLKKAPFASTP